MVSLEDLPWLVVFFFGCMVLYGRHADRKSLGQGQTPDPTPARPKARRADAGVLEAGEGAAPVAPAPEPAPVPPVPPLAPVPPPPRPVVWSGVDHGPLPLRKFTALQQACMSDAVAGKRIVPQLWGESTEPASAEVAVVAHRTVESLVRHGLLAPDPAGGFVCTDLGAQAHAQVPVRARGA